ncbi:MAG: glycosyltransferase family 4 protein [Nitrososphaerota archaeon]|jgi:glycosyltransferase involved in cell wall biosynthesis|nr:glycosyltransferase family 4 protein [Nitrososphaerota archaeon]
MNKKRENELQNGLFEDFHMIAFLNSYSEGLSGSDLRFIELAERIGKTKKLNLTIVTSNLGKRLCEARGLTATFSVTSKEDKLINILPTYIRRIIFAMFLRLDPNKNCIFYSTSDFLPDVFPVYVFKLTHKQTKWVQLIHHIQKNPFTRKGKSFFINFLGFLSQRLSFELSKSSADLTIVVNPAIKDQLLQTGFNRNKIVVNYNGVDLHKIQNFIPSKEKFDCVFLGRINVSKGIFDLIDVWHRVVSTNPKAKLAIIGKGDNHTEKQLYDYITKLHLHDHIHLCGYLNDLETFGILKSSKVFIFPSYEEGFGIAILQAMACSLPVVAYNLPVYREIFENTIVTVPLGNTKLMSERVTFLLENPAAAKSIGAAGVELASDYDWDKIAQREIQLIERLNGDHFHS